MRLILTLCQIKGSPGFCGGLQTSRADSDEGSVKTRRGHPPAMSRLLLSHPALWVYLKAKVVAINFATTFLL